MNNKHIALVIVGIAIAILIQTTLWVQGLSTKMRSQAESAEAAENQANAALILEKAQVSELKRQSGDLLDFLQVWLPYFQAFETQQAAEINFTLKVKESNLLNLAQRFDVAPVVGNASISSVMRAFLTFEDDYARLLNWLGGVEKNMPTVRVSSVKLSKGSRANELRMEAVLEQPLLTK